MRTLSTTTSTEVAKVITQPFYVAYLGFPAPVRLSTRGAVTWNSQTWLEEDLKIQALSTSKGAILSGALRIANHTNTYSSLILNNGVANRICKIWALYGAGPYSAGDAVLLFDGVMDGADIGVYVKIQITSQSLRTSFVPRFTCAPPVFNHMPPRGTVITWQNEQFILEGKQ